MDEKSISWVNWKKVTLDKDDSDLDINSLFFINEFHPF